MFRIGLVNMPFASLHLPSIALTQLKAVTEERFGDRVAWDLHYLNHDFGALLGADGYALVSDSLAGTVSGLGEWLFRRAAFPDLPDNRDAFLGRFAAHFTPEQAALFQRAVLPRRGELVDWLDRIIDAQDLDRCDLIGLTSLFQQNMAGFALARRLRQRHPDRVVVMGGANVEGTMGIEVVHHVPWLDWVFSGHALVSFPMLVERLLAGDRAGCDRIDGVFSRRNSRPIRATGIDPAPRDRARPTIEDQLDGIGAWAAERDINQVVPLDYDGFLDSHARHFPEPPQPPEVLFETSRGCWWGERSHCTFCGLNGQSLAYRTLRPELARGLLDGLLARYADRVTRFAAVDNICPKEYPETLFPDLAVPPHVAIFYEVRATLPPPVLATLARARVVRLQPGIESLDTGTLKAMRKGTTAARNIAFLRACGDAGVLPLWNLLVGFPGETAATYARYGAVMPRLQHLQPPSGVFPVRFDRFSPYFIDARVHGLDLHPSDFYGLVYPFDGVTLMNMAYYFTDRNYGARYIADVARWFRPLHEGITRWQARHHGADGLLPARLRPVADGDGGGNGGGMVIEDTRTGHRIRHVLSPAECRLLAALAEPAGRRGIEDSQGAALEALNDKGLVFDDGNRVTALVGVAPGTVSGTVSGNDGSAATPPLPLVTLYPAAGAGAGCHDRS